MLSFGVPTRWPEKSDLSIVATKPANKSEGAEAEPVERRERAEGNRSRTQRIIDRLSSPLPFRASLTRPAVPRSGTRSARVRPC